jgi:hypothetical protein
VTDREKASWHSVCSQCAIAQNTRPNPPFVRFPTTKVNVRYRTYGDPAAMGESLR